MKRLIAIFLLLASLASCSPAQAKLRHYGVRVVREYPHATDAYTQGLFFHAGKLYESTGQYGESSLRVVSMEDGRIERKLDFARKYFVEGSCVFAGKLYILTWMNKLAFIYDAETLSYGKTVRYPREGWGLTTDGKRLIASDGSPRLYFMDEDLRLQGTLTVKLEGKAIANLNELEYIDGKIWANVYTSDLILIINPSNGVVEATVDCSGLLPRSRRTARTDVLNGIAVNPGNGKIYLTGKYWPALYEVELVEKK